MSMDPTPLDIDTLEEQLDEILEAALSSRRTATGPAQALANRSAKQQHALLHWLPILARINPEMAFQCAQRVPPLMDQLDDSDLDRWLSAIIDRYDRDGLQHALTVLKQGPPRVGLAQGTVFLADSIGMLGTFMMGLGGRRLSLTEGEQPHTDTETLFLPAIMDHASQSEDNLKLYRCLVTHLWGLGRYGTFFPQLFDALSLYPDPDRAGELYMSLEACRMDAIITCLLPGLGRFMTTWQESRPLLKPWQQARADLSNPSASRETSLGWLSDLYHRPIPVPLPFHGARYFRPAMGVMQRRIEQEKNLFRKAIANALPAGKRVTNPSSETDPALTVPVLPDTFNLALVIDGQLLTPPENVQTLATSILQDLGEIPPEYLTAAGSGRYRTDESPDVARKTSTVWSGTYHEEGTFLYDEWDFRRNDYRKSWCVLRELPITPADDPFVASTLEKYHGLVQNIRRSFEMLRGSDRWLKRQEHGDEVDMDALIQALVDVRIGLDLDDRLFQRRKRYDRDVAAMILVDMSGSTKGWVNDAIRESLVLLCQALKIVGDRYAVYGFTGLSRKRCELYRIKTFDMPYGPDVENNIAGIQPLEYTRMGVFLRHATGLLNRQEARIRLLITLTDGKPDDYDGFRDGYRGQYGMEDTRKALIEARRTGIHPFCITIDTEARDYLPHLYGPARFVVLDDVRSLPLKITDIYRRWTT